MKCEFCGKKLNKNSNSRWCSKSCYNRDYYYKHKEILLKRHSEWWKVHHPKKIVEVKQEISEEEKKALEIKRRKEYYQAHKEIYKKHNKEWYAKHRNDPDVKRRHAIAMKKYNQKRRQNKEN